MSVENVRREMPVHGKLVGRVDALIEPQRDDAENLCQRGLLLGAHIVAQAPLELAQD